MKKYQPNLIKEESKKVTINTGENLKISAKTKTILLIKNWRFWFKLILGILPLISVIIFTSVSLSDMLYYKNNYIFPKNWTKAYDTTLTELETWSSLQISFAVIFRNLTLYTSYSSYFFSAFFLISAFNSLNEGKGRYDNSQIGLFTMVIMGFTLFFYNISLPITGDFKLWVGVQWMSMFLQHSLLPFIGVVYYFAFYRHHTAVYSKRKMLVWWGYSMASVMGYFIFFTILGYILKATNAWKPMPDMSFSGYFPYVFMEFTEAKANYIGGSISIGIQTLILYLIFIIVTSGCYFGFYFAQNRMQKKYILKFSKSSQKRMAFVGTT